MTAPDNSHVPTIAQQHDNHYGVHCLACSDLAQDYVWPCREGWTSGVPAVLVAADALAAAREELADTQQASQDAVRGLAETVEDMRRNRDAAREELARLRVDLGNANVHLTKRANQVNGLRAELAEAKGEEERYRQESRDSATTAGKALRELAEAKTLLHTIWYGTVNAPACERWLRLMRDAVPAAAPQADEPKPAPCGCLRHRSKDGSVTLIEDLCCPFHGVDATTSADDWLDPATFGPEEAYRLDVSAVPGDGEQAVRMAALHAAYDEVGMTHTGPTQEGDGEQAATTCGALWPGGYFWVGEEPRPTCVGLEDHEGWHAAPYLGPDPLGSEYRWDPERYAHDGTDTALPTSGQA